MEITVFELLWFMFFVGVILFFCFKMVKELEEERKDLALRYNWILFRIDYIIKKNGLSEDFHNELDSLKSMPWEVEEKE